MASKTYAEVLEQIKNAKPGKDGYIDLPVFRGRGKIVKDSEIENRFSFKCSKKWEDLNETDEEKVKLCNQCNELVYLAESVEELDDHAEHGQCVALHLKDSEGLEQEGPTGVLELTEPMKRQPSENGAEVTGGDQFEMLGYLRPKEEYSEPATVTRLEHLDLPPRLGRVAPAQKNSPPDEVSDGQQLRSEQYYGSLGIGHAFPYKKFREPQKKTSRLIRLLKFLGFNKGA